MIESPDHFNNRQSYRDNEFSYPVRRTPYQVKIGRKSGAFIGPIEGAIG